MGMNDTPLSHRTHIGFFGCRNAGKSSLVNAVTGQYLAVVSDVLGTTTDPVKKTMELLPIGPVVIIDTPGFDDEGALGELRIEKTRQVLRMTDIAVLVIDKSVGITESDGILLNLFKERGIPYVIACNKADLKESGSIKTDDGVKVMDVSAKDGTNIRKFKELLATLKPSVDVAKPLVSDLVKPMDFVVLVTPVDSAAPKGRLILPQQQMIRDLLEAGAVSIVIKETELKDTLEKLGDQTTLVITDSQAFEKVSKETPSHIPLTSFSILMARFKGFLNTAVKGADKIKNLKDGDRILIAEGCTHHRQCDDIGSVKLPRWLKEYTGKDLDITLVSGGDFPEDLTSYSLVIHCGGCMLNGREIRYRMERAVSQNVPFTNYGTAIACMKGILERSLEPVKDSLD